MRDRILKLRELNRATLARQMLLKREPLPVLAAVQRLVGMQAQLPVAPYVGLWTRLHEFSREDLARAIESHEIVKATLMRATLHLCTADDYLRFRTTLQPMLSGAGDAIVKQRGGKFDSKKLLAEARRYIGERPRTFAETGLSNSCQARTWAHCAIPCELAFLLSRRRSRPDGAIRLNQSSLWLNPGLAGR